MRPIEANIALNRSVVICATLLRQTERKFLLQLGAGPGLVEMSPQERSRNPANEFGIVRQT